MIHDGINSMEIDQLPIRRLCAGEKHAHLQTPFFGHFQACGKINGPWPLESNQHPFSLVHCFVGN